MLARRSQKCYFGEGNSHFGAQKSAIFGETFAEASRGLLSGYGDYGRHWCMLWWQNRWHPFYAAISSIYTILCTIGWTIFSDELHTVHYLSSYPNWKPIVTTLFTRLRLCPGGHIWTSSHSVSWCLSQCWSCTCGHSIVNIVNCIGVYGELSGHMVTACFECDGCDVSPSVTVLCSNIIAWCFRWSWASSDSPCEELQWQRSSHLTTTILPCQWIPQQCSTSSSTRTNIRNIYNCHCAICLDLTKEGSQCSCSAVVVTYLNMLDLFVPCSDVPGRTSSPEPTEPSPFKPKPSQALTRACSGLGPGFRF